MEPHSKEDKEAALRAVIFDAAVLAMALDVLTSGDKPQHDVGRGEDQLAVETALIKFRSLYDFLFPEVIKNQNPDNLVVTDIAHTTPVAIENGEAFRTSVHKYSAHLTWTRIAEQSKNSFLPRSGSLRQPCEQVLEAAWKVISEAMSNGYTLNNYGQKYYDQLQKRMNARAANPLKIR